MWSEERLVPNPGEGNDVSIRPEDCLSPLREKGCRGSAPRLDVAVGRFLAARFVLSSPPRTYPRR